MRNRKDVGIMIIDASLYLFLIAYFIAIIVQAYYEKLGGY